MFVGTRMTPNPVTVTPETSIDAALHLMLEHKVRRLPVLDKHGQLVGMVSEKDLLYASPSPVTSLSIYEIPYLLSKLTVGKIMARDIITIEEATPLEEAARIMADYRVSGLPVLRGENLVGIITETDIFKTFLEMVGARTPGIRLTLRVPNVRGQLAKVTGAISGIGGNIFALGTFSDDEGRYGILTIKVGEVTQDALQAAMKELNVEVLDMRVA